ncbi:MAG: class I SAM-dependent methyltransferase [Bryobacteraceae bacterium]
MTFKQRIGAWLFVHLPITRFLFDQLRVEVNAAAIGAANNVIPARRKRIQEFRQRRDLYVNVACGPHVAEGMLNIDLFPAAPSVLAWDCRWTLPVSDGGAAGIRIEQFVEHLETREELPSLLRDCHRALKPNGVLRIIVPDAERYLQAYCRGDLEGFRELNVSDPWPADLPTRMDFINHVFHQWHEHRWAYDFETLAHRVRSAGFDRVEKKCFRQSIDPVLACDREVHAPYSLYVDAIKSL